MHEDYESMSTDRLLRKRDQHQEMMSLALRDGDTQDAQRHADAVKAIREELDKRAW